MAAANATVEVRDGELDRALLKLRKRLQGVRLTDTSADTRRFTDGGSWPDARYAATVQSEELIQLMGPGYLVAVVNRQVVGYASSWIHPHTGRPELGHLYLLSRWQRQGIGTAMRESRVELLRSRGYTEAFIEVLATNPSGRGFNDHRAGVVVSEYTDEQGRSQVTYRLNLLAG